MNSFGICFEWYSLDNMVALFGLVFPLWNSIPGGKDRECCNKGN